MIRVTIHKTADIYDGFVITGHSGYGESGSDIVCASVSILGYTAVNAINMVAGIGSEDMIYSVGEDDGLLEIKTIRNNRETNIIYESFLVGIRLLLEDYSDYITLDIEEV